MSTYQWLPRTPGTLNSSYLRVHNGADASNTVPKVDGSSSQSGNRLADPPEIHRGNTKQGQEHSPLMDHHINQMPNASPDPSLSYTPGTTGRRQIGTTTRPSPQSFPHSSLDEPTPYRPRQTHQRSDTSLRKLARIWSPDEHKYVDRDDYPHARDYNYRRARERMFISGLFQWGITAALSASIAAALFGYEKWTTISRAQKHVFNALITGLSIALGINLASSFRSYASWLRWRLLACAWLSLTEFDLVLSCTSQLKTLKLMMVAKRKTFPYVSIIQLLCFIWLFVNVAIQVLVTTIGLTYSLDQSDNDLLVNGNISVVDLRVIADKYNADTAETELSSSQQFASQSYGIQGQDYSFMTLVEGTDFLAIPSYFWDFASIYNTANYNTTIYPFTSINADPSADASVKSARIIYANAACTAYDVLNEPEDENGFVRYNDGVSEQSLHVKQWSAGCVTYTSESNLTCGTRCTRVLAFQKKEDPGDELNVQLAIDKSTIFDCNNSISEMQNASAEIKKYDLSSAAARSIAGAIGWTGFMSWFQQPDGVWKVDSQQHMLYPPNTDWSPPYRLTASDVYSVARLIQEFSMSAIAAMDDHANRVIVYDEAAPIRTDIVRVEWRWTLTILVVIPAIQLLALILVVIWANKALIKEDSFLSIARLLSPIVERLEEHGTILTRDEIADAPEFGRDYRISYGYRGKPEEVMKVDIIEPSYEGENREWKGFKDGVYQ